VGVPDIEELQLMVAVVKGYKGHGGGSGKLPPMEKGTRNTTKHPTSHYNGLERLVEAVFGQGACDAHYSAKGEEKGQPERGQAVECLE